MKKTIRVLSTALAVVLMMTSCGFVSVAAPDTPTRDVAAEKIPDSELRRHWQDVDASSAISPVDGGMTLVGADGAESPYTPDAPIAVDDTLRVQFEAPAGNYRLLVSYQVTDDKMLDNLVGVTIGETSLSTNLQALWKDEQGAIPQDRYGNEVSPQQERVEGTFDAYITAAAPLR